MHYTNCIITCNEQNRKHPHPLKNTTFSASFRPQPLTGAAPLDPVPQTSCSALCSVLPHFSGAVAAPGV